MKLIVGLGNPGKEYNNTRHNVGFMVIDKYLESKGLELSKSQFFGKYTEAVINQEKVIFLEPQKYMNLSGEVVRTFVKFYKIETKDILIINDDLDMECGKIRLREKGSSGGHNGLKNIEQNIGTNEYKRLKVGIANNKGINTKDYVLGKFNLEEKKIINESINVCIEIIDNFFKLEFVELMNKYN